MRTLSTSPTQEAGSEYDDLDSTIVDGIEALQQRIVQAIRFRVGTWFLARNQGLNYSFLIGHRTTPDLAASVLNETIREEGGDEVLELQDVQFSIDSPNREFRYSVNVKTIYGDLQISEG